MTKFDPALTGVDISMREPPQMNDSTNKHPTPTTRRPDNITYGRDAETCITFQGGSRDVCNIWTNDRTVVTRMSRVGFEPDEETEHGVQYIGIPTKRVFRPSKARGPVSQKQKVKLARQLAKARALSTLERP